MITATINDPGGLWHNREIVVHGLANRGEWFGKTWIAVVSISNALHAAIVIEADHEQDAIDSLADSSWSHLIDSEECWDCGSTDHFCDCDHQSYGGNDSHRISLDYLSILLRCKVHYFEDRDRRFELNNSRVTRKVF